MARLTAEERALLAKLAEEDDEDQDDDEEGTDEEEEPDEFTYKGKRYRAVPDEEPEPEPKKGKGKQTPADPPKRRRFVT